MQRLEARAFLLLLAASSVLFGWLLLPFFDVLFWSVVIAVLFSPINACLRDRRGMHPNMASLLTVLFCLVIIILPLAWLLYSCVTEGVALYERLAAGTASLMDAVDRLREHFPEAQAWLAQYGYTPEQIKATLSRTALSIGSLIAKNTVALGGSAAHLVTNLALVLYISFFLVRDGGRIRIKGRIKEIIVTSVGEKVSPVDLEFAILEDPLFDQVMVVGENRPYVAALVVLNNERWRALCADLQVNPDDPATRGSREVRNTILKRVRSATKFFPRYGQPRNVAVLPDNWTTENGLLTTTMKLRRRQIAERYAAEIEELYKGHGA